MSAAPEMRSPGAETGRVPRCSLPLPGGGAALLGYACVNLTLDRGLRTLRLATLRARGPEVLHEIVDHNMALLADILDWNRAQGIAMFRLSSDLVPFGSHPEVNLAAVPIAPALLARIASHATSARLSMHPGQFTVLSTPDAGVLERSVAEVAYHAALLDRLGIAGDIILHGGGVYGDRIAAQRRLTAAIATLPDPARRRLCLENDERSWSVMDLVPICEDTEVPLVVDSLHHALNDGGAALSGLPWERIARTWTAGPRPRRPKVHYSEQDAAKRPGAHAAGVTAGALLAVVAEIGLPAYDIMLECKDKDRALLRLVDDLATRGALAR